MPIDDGTYALPATRGDVAGVAIHCSAAFMAITRALDEIAKGEKPTDEQIAIVRKAATVLDEHFDRLSGWKP